MSIPLREYCVGGCGNKLPATPEHYEQYGNWCHACTRRTDQNSYYRRRKSLQQKQARVQKQPSLERYGKLNEEIYKRLEKLVEKEMAIGYPPPVHCYIYKGKMYINHITTQ